MVVFSLGDRSEGAAIVDPGRYPSGQRGRAVNPLRYATLVRIQPGPLARLAASLCSVPLRSQHLLHQDDVEPLAELAADLAFGADLLEAARLVQLDRRVVAADDAGDRPSGSRGRGRGRRARRAAARRRRGPGGRGGRRPSPRPSACRPDGAGTGVSEANPTTVRAVDRDDRGMAARSARRSTPPGPRACGARGRRSPSTRRPRGCRCRGSLRRRRVATSRVRNTAPIDPKRRRGVARGAPAILAGPCPLSSVGRALPW